MQLLMSLLVPSRLEKYTEAMMCSLMQLKDQDNKNLVNTGTQFLFTTDVTSETRHARFNCKYSILRRDTSWADIDKMSKGGITISLENYLRVLDVYRLDLYEMICYHSFSLRSPYAKFWTLSSPEAKLPGM